MLNELLSNQTANIHREIASTTSTSWTYPAFSLQENRSRPALVVLRVCHIVAPLEGIDHLQIQRIQLARSGELHLQPTAEWYRVHQW